MYFVPNLIVQKLYLEIPVDQHLLQSLDSISTNWIFHFEFKVTSDTLGPMNSEIIRALDDEGSSLAGLAVKGSLTLSVAGFMFQPKKNVYHKVVITNIFSPIHNACLKEVRIDGKFVKSVMVAVKLRSNVKVHAARSGIVPPTQNALIRNFYLLDLEKDF